MGMKLPEITTEQDAQIRRALLTLAETPPQNLRTCHAKRLAANFPEEIEAAQKAGYGWRAVLDVFRVCGVGKEPIS